MPGRIQPPHRGDIHDRLKQALVTGLTLTVPLLITVVVVSFIWGFIFGTLQPLTGTLQRVLGISGDTPEILLQIVSLLVVVVLVVIIGFLADSYSGAKAAEQRFDRAMGAIPGIGSVYQTFNEMSELVFDADTESFQEIKLVEFPTEGSYATGFVTAETPEDIQRQTGHEDMLTIYVPLAPNPLMGGYVLHVSPDRCIDVDMSVEEGLKTIMTSGVAIGDTDTVEAAPLEYSDSLPDGIVQAGWFSSGDRDDEEPSGDATSSAEDRQGEGS
ncbi:hypothetical protein HLRTI_003496 [Halorhabdus tiamatea SARL4B]|uniref:DUF502 domain-containing protein n=1 Tax=Halorhabdus tiamatea SARL4B TaxID=1033806 RepID=U2DWF3_9EURY|nr:DUF502 domain-containing protein [Halorhabdus tiamatea]ERJ04543.1 hypothetical protein HLRTI_003496 [Halorhabdus tiamatea SARL4B]